MGHRHLFNTSQMFENEQEQNWNHMHVDHSYTNLARAGPLENGSSSYPVEHISVDGVCFSSQWNPAPMSNGYNSTSHNAEVMHYQPDPLVPSHDPFQQSSTAGTFYTIQENYVHDESSSSYDRQTFHGIEGGLVDLTMGNGRGPHKRKSPGVPSSSERGGTSGGYIAGSSSNPPLSSEVWPKKPSIDPQYMPWECTNVIPSHRGNLSFVAEGSTRNVRSRPAINLEPNLTRIHMSSNPPHNPPHNFEHSFSMDFSSQSSGAMTHGWSDTRMSPAHGRIIVSDASGSETNHVLVGSSMANAPVDARGYPHDFISSSHPTDPQSCHDTSSHSLRGVRSSYSQRSVPRFPTVGAAVSSLHLGHAVQSDESLQLVAESYSSRQPRTLSTIGWRNSDRNGRSRISYERFRLLSSEVGLHDRFSSAGLMVMDRSVNGSRNMLDQHRNMRLDIDNMSYEELLALGERIGTVSTGLSEELISKCLTQTVYCSSDQNQEEGTCVICLEEYMNMDDVGSLNTCGHDYHVSCIKKWLSMKNLCPICKASALDDNMKSE